MPLPQTDLFAPPLLSGLTYAEAIVTPAEEQALIAEIDAIELTPFRFQGWLGKRLTASFGWNYDFDHARFARAAPMPDFLLALRARAAGFAGLDAAVLEQALLIRYDPGAGIGWHRDRPVFEHVIGVSLGCVLHHALPPAHRRRVCPRVRSAGATVDLSHGGGGAAWVGT